MISILELLHLLQWTSLGLAALSAGLWAWSAKVPLNLEYSPNEPFVLDLKVLQARAEQLTNDAAIKTAFTRQSLFQRCRGHLRVALGVPADRRALVSAEIARAAPGFSFSRNIATPLCH